MVLTHQIHLDERHPRRSVRAFRESKRPRPRRMVKIDDDQRFGIELELSSPIGIDSEMIADMMPPSTGDVIVVDTHSGGKQHHANGWKIVPDGSIVCNRNMPECNKFELVSNILVGGDGLRQISAVTKALGLARIQVNKSMGFHVHVDVLGYSIEQLIKICQNFIKVRYVADMIYYDTTRDVVRNSQYQPEQYEDVMDSFMPPSRRNGSQECESYFRSNRGSVLGNTNRERHDSLADCGSIEALAQQMNENGRCYKLNLKNLVTKRQATLEFRQHSATLDYEKISAWVRFWYVKSYLVVMSKSSGGVKYAHLFAFTVPPAHD